MTTGKEISQRLGMHPTSLQKAGIRMAAAIDRQDLILFLEGRVNPAGAWKSEKAASAAEWYKELTGEDISTAGVDDQQYLVTGYPSVKPLPQPIPKPAPSPKPQPKHGTDKSPVPMPETIAKHWIKSDATMVVLLLIATGAQILHTSSFFYFITPIPGDVFRIATAILVGFAVDSAALIKTIRSGNRIYLLIFGIGHFFVNLSAHFRFIEKAETDIDTTTYLFFAESCLLSFLVAFAVYSYSEAFAFKK